MISHALHRVAHWLHWNENEIEYRIIEGRPARGGRCLHCGEWSADCVIEHRS